MKKIFPFVCVLLLSVVFSCSKRQNNFNSDVSLFKDYILNFSSGLISVAGDIRVVLAFENPSWQVNQTLDSDLFSIYPNVKGKVVALSSNTLSFVPEDKLKSDQEYQVTLHLDELKSVDKKLKKFQFTVKTHKQDFMVVIGDLQSYSRDYQYLNMYLQTSDVMDLEVAKQLITAGQDKKSLKIKFDNTYKTGTFFKFVIDSIQRKTTDAAIEVAWDGKKGGIDQTGGFTFEIPSKDTFKIISAQVSSVEENAVFINFTDPLMAGQDLSGLVQIAGVSDLKFATAGNLLKVYYNTQVNGEHLLEVFQGIKRDDGKTLLQTFSKKIAFENIKPGIRFVKSGTLLPSSNNLKISFEAAGLKAVDVKVYKIYKNNILQFLQDNELNGKYNLRKVAQPIAKQKIDLSTNKMNKLGSWNAYALDLSKLIETEPGAIYRIELSFNRKYAVYPCTQSDAEESESEEDETDEEVRSNQDYYDDYDYYDYDWSEREDPCTDSYYYQTKIGTNVIATDLGVIVKNSSNGKYTFAVADIVTAKPVTDATVELFTFQQQSIGTCKTNSEGFATFDAPKYAYFALVTKGKNATYIKLDEGNSLSMSNFDIAGETLQKGLKGFIYAERGVWRPGDSIYLSFMLNDLESKLDKNHPIQLKVSNPRGKLRYRATMKYNDMNHYTFKIVTNPSDPTGNWEAKISVGGTHFYKSIKIETIKPNRLKIKNSFAEKDLYAGTNNQGFLDVNWLHGAVAKNLKVEVSAKFLQQKTTFKGLESFDFDDDARKFSTEELQVFSGQLNENGRVNYTLNPQLSSQAPGKLKMVLMSKAYEMGGDVSTDVSTAVYSPFQTYVGIKTPALSKYNTLDTNKNNTFEIKTIQSNGAPKAVSDLEIMVYKMDSRWWWNADSDNLSQYNYASVNSTYKKFKVSTNSQGMATFNLNIPEADWGSYLIRVEDVYGKHATSTNVMFDWPIWSGKTKVGEGENSTMLMFSVDKESYEVGEVAKISFPSSEGSRALISIENGSNVLSTLWIDTKKGETQVDLKIVEAMAPNVYIHITLLKPHASTVSDAPIRMYGVIPLNVVNKNTKLKPVIKVPSVIKPEQFTEVTVSETAGREMTYTLAIVDDGLLDLTRFKTPDAWAKFYSRQALGVKTWDVYNDVIGAYGGKINQVFSIGGDAELAGGSTKKANRFEPVVIHLGPFKLDKNKSKTHKIKIPNYIGSLRVMVVAQDAKHSAYGLAEQTVTVRKPLMVLASAPRKMAPNEQVLLPITVFAMENHVKNVAVQIKTSQNISIVGSATQNISFSQPDEKLIYFILEAKQWSGIGKIDVIATSGNEKATYSVSLDLVNPNPKSHRYVDVVLEPNGTETLDWNSFGIPGSNEALVEVSAMPSINYLGRLSYLVQYPHGCLEQVTSGVFPQLYLSDVVDLDAAVKSNMQRNINAGIQKISNYQMSNGGFSYWPGQMQTDDWATSYVGHFLLEAEKKGYILPIGFKSKWIAFQQSQAKQWRNNPQLRNDLAQSYRLYTLALSNNADLASMNRLKETPALSTDARLRLAATYALVGQKKVALSLIDQGANEVTATSEYYGSEDRSKALMLETYVLTGSLKKAYPVAISLSDRLTSDAYMSTQSTAFSLYAMAKFASVNPGKSIHISLVSQQKKQDFSSVKPMVSRSLKVMSGANTVKVINKEAHRLYVRLNYSGVLPVGQEQVISENLSAQALFSDRKGNVLDVSSVEQGSELVYKVTISNNSSSAVSNLALSQIVPSGFEIVNLRYTDAGDFAQNKADYIDIRDDRTQFYFSLRAGERRTFTMLLNASYLGNYYLPGIQCEAMYDPNFIVRTKGQWVHIIK